MHQNALACGSLLPVDARRSLRQRSEIARVFPGDPEVADSVALAAASRSRFRCAASVTVKVDRLPVSPPCGCSEVVRLAGWSKRRALGNVRLLGVNFSAGEQTNRSAPFKRKMYKTAPEKPAHKAPEPLPRRLRHLYWIPAGSFQVGILNCGSS